MYLYGMRSPANLGGLGFRPNQAVQRSVYRGRAALQGLADDAINVAVDPTFLIAGVGALALAMLLWTGRRAGGAAIKGYRRRRLKSKRAKLQQQLFALGK